MPRKPNPYQTAGDTLLRESGCVVRAWRTNNTGMAYSDADDWGIIVPRPRGPISFGVFAHEVGHQMLHRKNGAVPRWLEEIEAEEWALAQFERFGLDGADQARRKAADHLLWAATKTVKRGSPATLARLFDRLPDWVWDYAGEAARDYLNRELEDRAVCRVCHGVGGVNGCPGCGQVMDDLTRTMVFGARS